MKINKLKFKYLKLFLLFVVLITTNIFSYEWISVGPYQTSLQSQCDSSVNGRIDSGDYVFENQYFIAWVAINYKSQNGAGDERGGELAGIWMKSTPTQFLYTERDTNGNYYPVNLLAPKRTSTGGGHYLTVTNGADSLKNFSNQYALNNFEDYIIQGETGVITEGEETYYRITYTCLMRDSYGVGDWGVSHPGNQNGYLGTNPPSGYLRATISYKFPYNGETIKCNHKIETYPTSIFISMRLKNILSILDSDYRKNSMNYFKFAPEPDFAGENAFSWTDNNILKVWKKAYGNLGFAFPTTMREVYDYQNFYAFGYKKFRQFQPCYWIGMGNYQSKHDMGLIIWPTTYDYYSLEASLTEYGDKPISSIAIVKTHEQTPPPGYSSGTPIDIYQSAYAPRYLIWEQKSNLLLLRNYHDQIDFYLKQINQHFP